MNRIQINLTGHPVPFTDIAPLIGVNLDLKDKLTLSNQVHDAISSIPESIIRRIRLGEAFTVALPGMTPAAGIALAILHGITGHWPDMRWSIRNEEGFVWPDECQINLDDIRTNSREERE